MKAWTDYPQTDKENREMKLREELPYEAIEYIDTPMHKLLDVDVVEYVDGCVTAWPGKHVNVLHWWKLANGKAVGWNENPSRGWSFPVIKYPA